MYEDLIGLLRDYGRDCTGNDMCENCSIQHFCENGWTPSEIADAIEELQQLVFSNDAAKTIAEKVPKWIPLVCPYCGAGFVFETGEEIEESE